RRPSASGRRCRYQPRRRSRPGRPRRRRRACRGRRRSEVRDAKAAPPHRGSPCPRWLLVPLVGTPCCTLEPRRARRQGFPTRRRAAWRNVRCIFGAEAPTLLPMSPARGKDAATASAPVIDADCPTDRLPFSFRYDHVDSAALLRVWPRRRDRAQDERGVVTDTTTWTEPGDGLQVTWTLRSYP